MADIKQIRKGSTTYDIKDAVAREALAGLGTAATKDAGVASGVAELDASGKVPSSQLPSYVDDVLEYASQSAFPAEGETGKIYVALDTNKTYRWSGTAYVEISESLALGETSSTAYAGDKGKANADNITAIQAVIPSGASAQDQLAKASDVAGKADKVASATNGNFAGLDNNGNITDSGSKASDFLTATDVSGKQNKTLDTTITVDGTQETTVEGALGAINTLTAANQTAISGIKDGSSIDSFGDVESAISGIQDGTTIDSFADVESALADKADASDLPSIDGEVLVI